MSYDEPGLPKGYWRDGQWKWTLLVFGVLAMIPAGIVMAVVTGSKEWLLLCVPIVFFLS